MTVTSAESRQAAGTKAAMVAETRAMTGGFDEFWRSYPRRVAKIAAHKAYDKALKLTTHETIMVAVLVLVAEYSQPAQGFRPEIKHPATWLNGGCWDDEPAPRQGNGHNGRRSLADAADDLIARTEGGQRTVDLGPDDYVDRGSEGRKRIGGPVREPEGR